MTQVEESTIFCREGRICSGIILNVTARKSCMPLTSALSSSSGCEKLLLQYHWKGRGREGIDANTDKLLQAHEWKSFAVYRL